MLSIQGTKMRQEDEYKCNEHSSGEVCEASDTNTALAGVGAEGREVSGSASAANTGRHPYCANCDIEILWPPTVVQGKTYCCIGCAGGGPCCCDYSLYRSETISGVVHYGPQVEEARASSDNEAS